MRRIVPIPQPPTALLGIPVALQAFSVSANRIALAAIYNATAVTNYTFQRSTSPTGPWTTIVQQISPSVIDGGLNPLTTYYYQVAVLTAETPARTTQWSPPASATTTAAAVPATKTVNPSAPLGGAPVNFHTIASAVATLIPGDRLELQAVGATSPAAPFVYAERMDFTGINGTQANPIIVSVRNGDYLMLDVAFGYIATGLPSGASADPGKSLLHFENTNWVFCDLRDQSKSTLQDFSQELDPTTNWAMALGNRAHWLATVTNTALTPLQRTTAGYRHYCTSAQINSNHIQIVGAQVNGSSSFASSFMARNCSWIDIRYCDIGCTGVNDQNGPDLWPMQGDHFRVIDCYTHHASHQNISFEGTNFITRRLRGNGGWTDIATGLDGDTYSGGNVSSGRFRKWNPMPFPVVGSFVQVPSTFDPGYSLHELNHYQNTGRSLKIVQGLPFLKLEGYSPIVRFSVFDHHRTADASGNIQGYGGSGSSSEPLIDIDTHLVWCHGRVSMYHNTMHITNGIYLYEDSELTAPVHPNHGGGNLIINNVFSQVSTGQNNKQMVQNVIAKGGIGPYPDNGKGMRVRNNLINYIGTNNGSQNFIFWAASADTVIHTGTLYGSGATARVGNNRDYVPAFVNVTALSNNLCTTAIRGVILAPANTDGLGVAEPLCKVTGAVTNGTRLTLDNVAPLFDGNGWADETPDTISILSSNGAVKTTVQLAANSRNSAANTVSTAAPVTTVVGDGIYIQGPFASGPLLNNGPG